MMIVPSSPSFIEALEYGHCKEATNLSFSQHTFPSRLGVNDEFIPNQMLDLSFMPLFVVVPFNPNGSKCNAPQKVPNFDHFTVFLRNSFSKQKLLPIKIVIVTSSSPTQFMHNTCGPFPCPSGLSAIPKSVFDRFASVREAKKTHCLEIEAGRCNASPLFINSNRFVPNWPNERGFFSGPERVLYL